MKSRVLAIYLGVFLPLAAHARGEIVDAPWEPAPPAVLPGAQIVGTTPAELSCLFKSAGYVKPSDADRSASAISRALANISFPSGTFTRTSLLHFMSQVVSESDHLRTDEQYGHLSFDKKGWSMIQVTGHDNFDESIACMDRFDHGRGAAVLAGTIAAVGNQAYDRFSSALMSLCYWRGRIAMNPRFSEISKQDTELASREMTQIVNAGGVGLAVTNGEKNLRERAANFNRILAADRSGECRP